MKNEDAMKLINRSMEQLEEAIKQGQSNQMMRFLAMMAKFKGYSFRNVMMIMEQFPEATDVAGYNAWKKMNRWVKSGESGIAIFAPVVGKSSRSSEDGDDPKAESTDDDDKEPKGYRVVHVFDISQTDGDPLPGISETIGNPGLKLEHMKHLYRDFGIKLTITQLPARIHGYSLGGEVRVADRLNEGELFSVLAHELAHELMHKVEARKDRAALAVRETEAEAVAFVVCQAFGIDSLSQSADYIALYQGDSALLNRSLSGIQRTSAMIITSLQSYDSVDEQTGLAIANS